MKHAPHRLRNDLRWRAKTAANAALARAGLRLIRAANQRKVVEQFHDAMVHWYFPGLPAQPGRVELMCELLGTPPAEAMFVVNGVRTALAVEGDICEFGVAQGTTSALIANEIAATGRTLWLYDSFEGLSRPTEKDVLIDDPCGLGSMENYAGSMAFGAEQVTRRVADAGFPMQRLRVVPGFVTPATTVDVLPAKVAFAYIDFDLYEPIAVMLGLLRERLSVGGVVVVDDYGYLSAGAAAAVDEFLAAHKDEFDMQLPPPFAGGFCVLVRVDDTRG